MNTPARIETVQVGPTAPWTAISPATEHLILEALADDFSERIMRYAVEHARTVEEISSVQNIPLSTCYRRIRELVDAGLVLVERIVITGSGKRYATYRSCFRSFRISAGSHGVVVEAEINPDLVEKLRDERLSIVYSGQSARQPNQDKLQ
jgi:DNA-binding Lrp family transcriptional regulator